MNAKDQTARSVLFRFLILLVCLGVVAGYGAAVPLAAEAQVTGPQPNQPAGGEQADRIAEGVRAAEAALGADEGQDQPGDEAAAQGTPAPQVEKQINLLELLIAGGYLMLPILAMSLLVVTFGVERMLGLRRRKVLPPELIAALGKLAAHNGGLDPRQAYKLCQQYPSVAANVIKTMLLKVGRPHVELEHAVSEANKREAARLYVNVRWLGLAAGVSPLLGLLGTVWGMIVAFFTTANLPTGANKAEYLADGIYVALVTTFAGLAVAIPAAVLAHFFETRIQRLFRDLDDTLLGLMPQLERFEGRLRVSKEQMEKPAKDGQGRSPRQAPAAEAHPPTPAASTPK